MRELGDELWDISPIKLARHELLPPGIVAGYLPLLPANIKRCCHACDWGMLAASRPEEVRNQDQESCTDRPSCRSSLLLPSASSYHLCNAATI